MKKIIKDLKKQLSGNASSSSLVASNSSANINAAPANNGKDLKEL